MRWEIAWKSLLSSKAYHMIVWYVWLYALQISTTTLGMIDDDCTVDDWWLGRFHEATRQKEYDHPKDDPWGFRMCLTMLAARIFLRMKLVSRLQRTLDFILIFSPTRGLKNGGPRLENETMIYLGGKVAGRHGAKPGLTFGCKDFSTGATKQPWTSELHRH